MKDRQPQIERRFTSCRTAGRGTNGVLSLRSTDKPGIIGVVRGYAAIFYDGSPGSEYALGASEGLDAVERIRPGAFKRALAEKQDVRALREHSPDRVLGRTAAGTLRLREDGVGLFMEIDLPATETGRETLELIKRGDLTGASFAFVPVKTKWSNDGGTEVRELLDLDLFDVSIVAFPAYQGTNVVADSRGKPAETGIDVRALRLADRERFVEHLDRLTSDLPRQIREAEQRERRKRMEEL